MCVCLIVLFVFGFRPDCVFQYVLHIVDCVVCHLLQPLVLQHLVSSTICCCLLFQSLFVSMCVCRVYLFLIPFGCLRFIDTEIIASFELFWFVFELLCYVVLNCLFNVFDCA